MHQYVVITGASTGIGRACAIRLARAGFGVIGTVRTQADAETIERAGAGTPRGIRAVFLDVADAASIQKAAAHIRELTGDQGVYALVNNAGICVVGPVETVTLEQWRYQFEVNFFGAIALTQAMLPMLRACKPGETRGRPRIVYINSVCGDVATPLFAAYSTSKFAQRALVDCQRLELRSHGIHVCSIVPGTIKSEIWRKEKEGVQAISADGKKLYGRMIENVSRYVFSCADKAIPADRVAAVLERCLQSRSPNPRYLVGWEAYAGTMARRVMPERLFQFMLAKTLGVPVREHM